MTGISREDLDDVGIVDAVELASDGGSAGEYKSVAAVSTTNANKQIDITGGGFNLNQERDEPPESGDLIILTGSTAADGNYTFDGIVSDFVFTVVEAIPDSTGGTVSFRHPSGATRVGVDSSAIGNSAATDLQTVLEDIDAAVAAGGITAEQHKTLRQAIHFIDEGPAEGFTSGAFKEVTGGLFPTAVVWWESAAKLNKIFEKTIERSAGPATLLKPTPIKWKIYDTDGSTVLFTISDAVTYSGAAEVSRTRTITAGDA